MTNDELKGAAQTYLGREDHPVFKKEVEDLLKAQNWTELNERFYTSLSFGTGGLRGTIGGGTNRMNPFMVRSATQGLANYVTAAVGAGKGSAVIAHDSRNYSDLFALEAALTLAANGIKTYLFRALRPTPVLSFAVRRLKATTGIVVTASHNPPEYNGYKVYWADGAQVVPPHDKGIIEQVRLVTAVKTISKADALAKGLLVEIDEEIDGPYVEMVKAQAIRPELFKTQASKVKVVYTPLHGTGITVLPRIMKDLGISLSTVASQAVPDGNFPTVASPNPEEHSAMKLAIEQATKEGADLILGTDPDADRIGIGVPYQGQWVLLNGNQLGALLADYIFSSLKALGKLPSKPVFVNTIVTTELHQLIVKDYGARSERVLTGFKYIGEMIKHLEEGHDGWKYVFGGEESYGFLFGDSVRDKDAISSAAITIEMALWHLSHGRSVMDALNGIYEKYGFFQEILISKTFKGQAGLETMKKFMADLRSTPPKKVGPLALAKLLDYQNGTTRLADGSVKKDITLPPSDVVQFVLEDGSTVTVRPSGTEPKIKFYASCRAEKGLALDAAKAKVAEKIQGINQALDGMIG
jgi:phosphoglucomutase